MAWSEVLELQALPLEASTIPALQLVQHEDIGYCSLPIHGDQGRQRLSRTQQKVKVDIKMVFEVELLGHLVSTKR